MKFVLIFGPQAVGKMAVGGKLADATGLKFLHNHMSIEFALNFFTYGTPEFYKLDRAIRFTVFEEVANGDFNGLIFTFTFALNLESDKTYIDEILSIFNKKNAEIYFIELEADLQTRLKRDSHPDRLRAKPSKKDRKLSEKMIREYEMQYVFNSNNDFFYTKNYIKIDNTSISLEETVETILAKFNDLALPKH